MRMHTDGYGSIMGFFWNRDLAFVLTMTVGDGSFWPAQGVSLGATSRINRYRLRSSIEQDPVQQSSTYNVQSEIVIPSFPVFRPRQHAAD